MKKTLKRTGRLLLILLCALIAFLAATTLYHHLSLKRIAGELVPNGTLVEVDGRNIHIYAEGEKGDKPTLIFMSGSATVAPVYDFKPLYSLLLDEYRIAVVEKTGYGYSDICQVQRDIDTMLEEVRQGLSLAGEGGPYVLFPHSMSGLEAIYWAQQYPDEVEAIIGLDMAVPESYEHFDASAVNRQMSLGRASVLLGLHRLPGIYSLNDAGLSEHDARQQRLLMHRNAVNINYILEGKAVYNNALKVKSGGNPDLPMLLFTSDGAEIGEHWLLCQEEFAAGSQAQLIQLDCGHYIHHFEAEYISEKALEFLLELSKAGL